MKAKLTISLLLAISLMCIIHGAAQTPGFGWAAQMGGTSDEYSSAIGVDPSGNVFTTGYFTGTVTCGSGINSVTLTSNGSEDIFIQKLDPYGNLLWACSMGDTAADRGWSLTTDAGGNVYVTGWFKYKMDADPGAGTYFLELNNNYFGAFILKLDGDGNLIWARQLSSGADYGSAWCYSVGRDASGNILTGGCFVGNVDFDPGAGIYNLSSTGTYDSFILKLDTNGTFIWVKQIKGMGAAYPYALVADASGNTYTAGVFVGTNDFDPAAKVSFSMTAKGGTDIFVEKLDQNGNFVWARQMGGNDNEYARSIALDAARNIYITGEFYGTVDFNPGSGTCNLTSLGQNDMFVEKLDINGNFTWVKQMGGTSWDAGYSIVTDAAGNSYLTGYSYETVDFDPGPGTHYLTTYGKDDVIIYKSDPDGNMVWVTQVGGTDYDFGQAIALDHDENIFTAGGFHGTADFDPSGSNIMELISAGSADAFVLKLNAALIEECPLPQGITAVDITESSAVLSWYTCADAVSYDVRFREVGNLEWTMNNVPAPGTNFILDGLTSSTKYEFQVRTICSESGMSNFTYSGTFITLGPVCVDNYEPNQSLSVATQIPVNTDITALIGSPGDVDWFKFTTVSTNKNVKITLTTLPADFNVALYNSSGSQIGISQNTGTADETIIYNTRKSGTYYIKVYGLNSAAFDPVHCYTLRAAASSADFKSLEEDPASDATSGLVVFPNPASTVMNLDFYSPAASRVKLMLLSMTGQILLAQEFDAVQGLNRFPINISDIRDGLYFLQLSTGSETYFRKIVIRK